MATDYEKKKQFAKKMVEKFGKQLTFTKPAGKRGTYSAATGDMTGGADLTITGYGVKLDYTLKERANRSILEGDQKIIFVPDSGELLNGMQIALRDGIWTVVDPAPLEPADVVVCYFAQVRQ